ncbi:hypothetical protein KL86CLO1_11324 [uncultured Eubacteriales bacterium]|uniref:Uncharacterized protein n=1 Tax=uncultured Eubacteriales bacterium TaxID=172733 RepID=A0A212JLJ9_9FIRM|nr:hypothetical protein KL86CLO1_11324 [uncultured Eubacteriales bacterium]
MDNMLSKKIFGYHDLNTFKDIKYIKRLLPPKEYLLFQLYLQFA